MRRHLHPCTKEPRGPLWLGLLLILGGMFGLLLLFTGCGSAAVSAGPAVGGSSGLGYDGASCGVQAVADRPGLRVSGHVSTARKAGSDDAGGAELRILSGLGGPRWALWYGLRGAVQRADYGTDAVWNPTLGASWRPDERTRLWLLWDAPDSSAHDTQAVRLEMEVGRQWVLAPGVEWVYFDGGREGWGYSVALRRRM